MEMDDCSFAPSLRRRCRFDRTTRFLVFVSGKSAFSRSCVEKGLKMAGELLIKERRVCRFSLPTGPATAFTYIFQKPCDSVLRCTRSINQCRFLKSCRSKNIARAFSLLLLMLNGFEVR